MKRLFIAGSVVLSLSACGSKGGSSSAENLDPNLRTALDTRVASLLTWAPRCGKVAGISYPALDPNGDSLDCGDGDSTNYNGLLCLSGNNDACAAVAFAQGPDGKIWRSPFRRLNGGGGVNTSSRDMFVGFMAYLSRTHDTARARLFESYVNSHGGRLCEDATDDRCDLLPTSYGLMAYVWDGIGLSVSVAGEGVKATLSSELLAEAEVVDTGYALTLVVDQLLVIRQLGQSGPVLAKAAAAALGRQPDNPLYRFVVEGSTSAVAQEVLDQAPTHRPSTANQWAVSRDTAEQAWQGSCGWDYVTVANLVEGK